LVTDFPEIMEMDINPLMVFPEGGGTMAIDARLTISQAGANHHQKVTGNCEPQAISK
jgi:acetyltransferase